MKEKEIEWENVYKDMSKEGLVRSFLARRAYSLAKDEYSATLNDNFKALAITIRDRVIERWIETQQRYHKDNEKRVYYLSLEFLMGRLLGTNMQNLELWDEVKKAMETLGLDIKAMRNCEADAGLGNGGLGRLAACFLDSMATLGIPAHGYGIRYDYGIFKQKIIEGYQIEFPDSWLMGGNPWEFERVEYATRIHFYGRTHMNMDAKGHLHVEWIDTEDILALPYDTPIVGYQNEVVNTLRLWSARSTEEFDLEYFNSGDYEGAVYHKVFSESISKVLYPNDQVSQGKELRLKQEYFFTASSIADIIRRFKAENSDFNKFPEKVAIQLNDTHPSLAIVELMRILVDRENLGWDAAWNITVKTFAYTNHTILPEALETWPVAIFEVLLPRHIQLIYEINTRFLQDVTKRFPGDNDRPKRMSIIEEKPEKRVRMAFLSIIGSHSVNGVSALHSTLLKTNLFKDFYEFFPKKFNNKTNGITQRRWLQKANYQLSDLISSVIGEEWKTDFTKLKSLLKFKDDTSFQKKWQGVKQTNKEHLAKYILNSTGITVSPDFIFDVQVKRMHEYKRQLLFTFYIISEYLKIKKDPKASVVPRTFIVAGKAAPGYYMAKLIIKFINNVAKIINEDESIENKLKLVFLENYSVSLAEKIFPASDLSEQISTAGKEASGTGNMKFMMNGALTIGTLDGANIEIADSVGRDNIFIFGLTVEEIEGLMEKGYSSQEYIKKSPMLAEIFNLIRSDFFSLGHKDIFKPITDSLVYEDQYFVCADFDSFCEAQKKVSKLYQNKESWTEKSIINVALSEKFSSDRTISEYAEDIWGVESNKQKTSQSKLS
ncbi:glycogen/starch/alpha-glucan phosphorylase [Candidatus Auribacterota bacterium]